MGVGGAKEGAPGTLLEFWQAREANKVKKRNGVGCVGAWMAVRSLGGAELKASGQRGRGSCH